MIDLHTFAFSRRRVGILAKRGSTKLVPFGQVGFLSGLVWILFHVPGILFAGYHSTDPVWYGLAAFSASFMALSFVLAWLRLKSGSV